MDEPLMMQGVMLMLAGMGTVFVFLTTLVLAMSLLSKVVLRMAPVPEPGGIGDAEVAAIAAAIRKHRER